MHVLDVIGNTSLVRLRKVVPADCAQILVKLAWENPSGSMKDRMAQAVISRAEADGRLRPGGSVVEYSGGSTGPSPALVCAAKGYRLHIVSSDAFTRWCPARVGLLILELIETARRISEKTGSYRTNTENSVPTWASRSSRWRSAL